MYSILAALTVTISGCYSQKKLINSNPTNYVFEASVEQVRYAIKKANETYQTSGLLYFNDKDYHYSYIFNDSKNANDAILNPVMDIKSKIYFRFGKPLPYSADFHIHLDSITENRTKVEIFTLNPTIVTFGIGYGHFGYTWEKKVPPSTIEEYEILLAIGRQLEEQGMPECNYPKKWLKYQAKEQERIKKRKEEFEKKKWQ